MRKAMLCSLLLWLGVTCFRVSAQHCDITSGRYAQLNNVSSSRDKSFYLGALLAIHEQGPDPLTCGRTSERGVQNLEAFLWALDNYKHRYPSILSGLDVGGLVFDTCSRVDRAAQQVLNLAGCSVNYGSPEVDPAKVFGFVGPSTNEETFDLAPLLAGLHKTLIGFDAAHDDFSNSTHFPYYFRTGPAAADEVKAILAIIAGQGWRYVQVLYGDDEYGLTAFATFQQLAADEGICVVFSKQISASHSDQDMERTLEDLLVNKETRAVVILADKGATRSLLMAAQRYYTLRGAFTWVGGSQWGDDASLVQSVAEVAEGAITVALDTTNSLPLAFQQHFGGLRPVDSGRNPWLREYWQDKFQCRFPGDGTRDAVYSLPCDADSQNLRATPLHPSVVFTIRAVHVLLNAIDATWKVNCQGGPTLCSGFLGSVGQRAQLRDAVFEVQDPAEFAFAPGSGDTVVVRYKVLNFRSAHGNCANHCYAKLGYYDKFEERLLLQEEFFVYDKQGQRYKEPDVPGSACPASPCTQCGDTTTPAPSTPAPTMDLGPSADPQAQGPRSELRRQTWVFALLVLAGLGVLLILGFEVYLMSKILGTPFVKHWRTMWLGQLLLLAVLLCYLTLFAFVPAPTRTTCAILRFGVGSSYAMCFAILLVKLMIILSSKSIGYLKGIYQVLMFIFAWGVQLVLDAEWLILNPPGVHLVNTTSSETAVWVCDVTFTQHVISLVYVMFLILMTTLIAVRTHGIITNHREGIFIGISAGFTIPTWLVWILLGMFNTDKGWQDPCMAFGLFFTATLILFTLFLPKVRQLNSMGVEGIYAEDDSPDGYAASIIAPSAVPGSVVAGSVILGPPSYKSKPNGSVVYVNGGLYADPTNPKPVHLHFSGDPNALYLRHPGKVFNNNTAPPSVRSAPPMYTTLRRPGSDDIQTNTRVLRMTGDLTGRPPSERHTQSEYNYNVQYGTTKSNKSSRPGMLSLKKHQSRSLTDLGAL